MSKCDSCGTKLNYFRDHIMLVNSLRNACAYHDILWHRPPSGKKVFQDILGMKSTIPSFYNDMLILLHLGRKQNAHWLGTTYLAYLVHTHLYPLDLTHGYGFPKDWQKFEMWQNQDLVKLYLKQKKEK